MKKLLLTACAVTCAISVFAQGQVQFNNRVAADGLQTHIYLGGTAQLTGNGANDLPAGTMNWAGYTAVLGAASGTQPFLAALMVNYGGSGVPTFAPDLSGFKSNPAAAGYLGGATTTLTGVGVNAPVNLNIFAWDTKSGAYADAAAAWNAWQGGLTAGGFSKTISYTTGGNQFTPGSMQGLESFNIFTVPEPSSLALAGLGAAAMLIFRRRK